MRKKILLTTALVLMTSNAFALSVTVDYFNSPQFSTSGLTGYATSGSMMDAMTVQVSYSDNSVQTASWSDTEANNGAASVSGFFELSTSGDTFTKPWLLNNYHTANITKLEIDAGAGKSVFDTIISPSFSPGSGRGRAFSAIAGDSTGDLSITATYSGAVAVNNIFYGDLYRYLTIDFNNSKGLGADNSLLFIADTDNMKDIKGIEQATILSDTPLQDTSDSITGIPEAVPEPSTILLLGGGLAGLLFYRNKKRS